MACRFKAPLLPFNVFSTVYSNSDRNPIRKACSCATCLYAARTVEWYTDSVVMTQHVTVDSQRNK